VPYHVITGSVAGQKERISYEYLDKINIENHRKEESKGAQISTSFIQLIKSRDSV